MKSFLQKFQKQPSQNNSQHATVADVYSCYRLLLNREPDPAGLAYWKNLVETQNVPVEMVADGFLRSFEFKQRQAERNHPFLVELPHFKIFVRKNDLFVGSLIAQQKTYEPLVTQAVQKYLQPSHVFVDIGANIGYFTLLAASIVGENGQVHAFEPIPENGDFLELSLAENQFRNVILYRNAVAEKQQTIKFTGGGADSNGRIINNTETHLTHYPLPTVEAITLDETLTNLTRLDLIKMDIEGAEPRAFAGMKNLINQFHPIILTEFSPQFITTTSGSDPALFLDELCKQYNVAILNQSSYNEPVSQSASQIMEVSMKAQQTHLDLIALPK